MQIKWLRLALDDIEDIAEYISKDNPKIAQKIVQLIYENVYNLIDHPNIGRTGRVKETRELYINGTPFTIPYRIKNNYIEILRVLHTSREWPKEF